MNYLGIDWGIKKIGLATGSDQTKLASPFKILKIEKYDESIAELAKIIQEEDIDICVVGDPLDLKSNKNQSDLQKKFMIDLSKITDKIELEDERMSTKLANVLERDFGARGHDKDDDLAATAILQTYLDRLKV
jgi:putative holliday junction resolvase